MSLSKRRDQAQREVKKKGRKGVQMEGGKVIRTLRKHPEVEKGPQLGIGHVEQSRVRAVAASE